MLRSLMAMALAVAAPVAAAQRPQMVRPGEVALEAAPLVRGGTVRAAVEVEVAPGLHVNANPPTYDYLIPLSVEVVAPAGVAVAEAYYPEPVLRRFPYMEEAIAVYEGEVVVGLALRIEDDAPLGEHRLELHVRYQACDDEACYPPRSLRMPVPVTIAPAGTSTVPLRPPLLGRAPFPEAAAGRVGPGR